MFAASYTGLISMLPKHKAAPSTPCTHVQETGKFYSYLTSALGEKEWSNSCPNRFIPWKELR